MAKFNGEDGQWITWEGKHIFIPNGKSKDEVVKQFISKSRGEDATKERKNPVDTDKKGTSDKSDEEDLVDKKNREIKEREENTKKLTAEHNGEAVTSKSDSVDELKKSLKDNTSFDSFVKENMSNSDFKEYGKKNKMKAVKDLWRDIRYNEELKNISRISLEDAYKVIDSTPSSGWQSWFTGSDSGVKDILIDNILSHKGVLNAGMNIAYENYKNTTNGTPMSFDKWLKTPQTLYRGVSSLSDKNESVFMSYSPDKRIADKVAGKD